MSRIGLVACHGYRNVHHLSHGVVQLGKHRLELLRVRVVRQCICDNLYPCCGLVLLSILLLFKSERLGSQLFQFLLTASDGLLQMSQSVNHLPPSQHELAT